MPRPTASRRQARIAAVLAATLGISVSGVLVAAGAAWSQGPRAHIAAGGHRHHHGSGGQALGGGSTTTQPTTTTTTSPSSGAPGATTATTGATGATGVTGSTGAAKKAKPKAKPKPKPKPKPVILTSTLATTIKFPERELGLWSSSPRRLTPSQVHVTENGQPVTGLSLRPLSQAGSRDFGVVVILDESSSLDFNTRGLELAAAQAIADQRTGQQQFGVITYSAAPTVMVPLTNNPVLITDALRNAPLIAPGSSVLPALRMAYSELHNAGMATGAVIVVTAGRDLASPADEAAASQAGLRMGYQTFSTDILANAVFGTSASHVGADDDAEQEKAFGAQLAKGTDIWKRLSSGYLASYRSTASPGSRVTVSVTVTGLTGTPTMTYTAVRPPAPAGPAMPPLSQLPALSAQPVFAQAIPAAAVVPSRTSSPFWSSPVSLISVSIICALLLAGSLWLLVGGPGRSELGNRVASFLPGAEEENDEAALALLSSPGVPPILARRRWWPGFVLAVDVARFRRSPVSLVKIALVGSLVACAVFVLIFSSLIGVLVGLPAGPFVLYGALRRAVRRSRTKFADQLPSTLQDMAGAVRGGRSLAGSMQAVSDGADEPILGEFERAVADEQLGLPLEESLHAIARRMKSEDMEQVALVATLHRRSGSSVAEALDHVAEGARERAELLRELRSLTGQARLSSRILTGLPIALFLALRLLEPGYMRPVTQTGAGIAVLLFCAFMVLMGWLAMKRVVKVEA